jgi:galactokinase/mevalonate kinase-like predicted kinase
LGPRQADFDVLANTCIDRAGARLLAEAAEDCWQAILAHDIKRFGHSFRRSFEAQVAMFPNMMNDSIAELIEQYQDKALGWKISGAGGGGYLIFVSDIPIAGTVHIITRRETE